MRVMIVLLVVASLSSIATAADPAVGDRVFVRAGAVVKHGDAVVELEKIPFLPTVEAIDGDLIWLGRGWVRKSDVMSTEDALTSYSDAIKQDPTNASALRSRAYVWLEKREVDKALEDCDQAVRLDSKNAANYIARAWARIFKEQYDKSFQDATTAIKLDPKSSHGYLVRGVSWDFRGDNRSAIKDFTEAIRLDPGDIDGYAMRASTRVDKDVDGAIKDYTQVIRLDPKNADAYHERGSLFEGTGDFGSALSDYGDSHLLNRNSAVVCNNLARILSSCPDDRFRDGVKAVEYGTKACELRGKDFSGDFGWLAAGYAEAGDFASAIKFGEKALSIAPDSAKKDYTTRLEYYRANKPWREIRLRR